MADESRLPYFLLGVGLGVAAGLLLAPQSGEETRALLKNRANEGADYLKDRANEGTDYVKRRGEELKTAAADAVERGKNVVSQQKDQVSSAVEAGKQAYREAMRSASAGSETA